MVFERCYVFPGVIPPGREPAEALEALQQRMRKLPASGDEAGDGGRGQIGWGNDGKTMGK